MCEECGVNFDNLLDTTDMEDMPDLLTMLSALFGDPEPVTSFLEERGLTPEYELSGEFDGKTWTVKVAQIPTEDIEQEHRDRGDQWWALDGYYDGEIVRSSEGAPPAPVTAKEAAEAYAEFHFDYIIP